MNAAPSTPRRDQASREILEYLIRHPDAKDTVEGILKWWLDSDAEWEKDEVQQALDLLSARGWLTRRETTPAQAVYGVNKDQIETIKKFVYVSN